MKSSFKAIVFVILGILGIYSITTVYAADASVGVSAIFINPKDEVKLHSNLDPKIGLLLAEASTPTASAQQNNSPSASVTPTVGNGTQSQNNQTIASSAPAYYVYSSRYDIALGYNPERLVVENLAGTFVISTWDEYEKYKVVPIAGQNLENALSTVNLKEYKFKNNEELVNAVLTWVKGQVYKQKAKFGDMAKEGDIYVVPFTYKELDYSALWQAYTRKAKKIDLNNYYVDKKGAVYLFVKDNVLIAIYAYNVSDHKEELKNIVGFKANLYIAPKFIKEAEYRIYGTNILFTFNQRYWIVMPNKNSLYMEFYHSKYESQPAYAALYSSTAKVFIAPELAYKEVTDEFLRERAISMGASDIKLSDPKLDDKTAKQKAEAKVSKVSTKHLTFYCYTSDEVEKEWGGYKPTDPAKKPKEYKQLCIAGKGKSVVVIRATLIKDSEGEKFYNSMLQSIYIEGTEDATANTTITPSPVSWFLDDQLHIVPVVKAAQAPTSVQPLDTGSLLGPLGTVKVFNLNCINFRVPVNKTTQAARIANKVYTLCGAGMGSGFAVDETHIVSNAHVMSPPPFMTLVDVYYSAVKAISAGKILSRAIDHGLSKDMVTLATAAVQYYQKQGARFSNYSNAVKGVALRLLKDTVTTATQDNVQRASNTIWATVAKNGYFAVQGDSIILKNSAQMSKVQLLKDYDITPNLLVSVLGTRALSQGLSLKPDLALGKVSSSLKVVPLPIKEESSYSPGAKITVIGYPGLIETSNILSVKNTYPTVTKGTISGVKNAAGANFKIVQINAAVAHGNSGGPVIDDTGKVVGVLTYSFSAGTQDAADLAGAVDIQEVRSILDGQHVSYNKSALTTKVLEAVSEYKKSHFKNAKKILEEVKQHNPTYFSYVLDPVLSKLQLYIDQGLDKSGFSLSPDMFGKYLLPVVGGLILIGLGIVFIKVLPKKKSNQPEVGAYSKVSQSPLSNTLPQIGSTPSGAGPTQQSATLETPGTPVVSTPSPAPTTVQSPGMQGPQTVPSNSTPSAYGESGMGQQSSAPAYNTNIPTSFEGQQTNTYQPEIQSTQAQAGASTGVASNTMSTSNANLEPVQNSGVPAAATQTTGTFQNSQMPGPVQQPGVGTSTYAQGVNQPQETAQPGAGLNTGTLETTPFQQQGNTNAPNPAPGGVVQNNSIPATSTTTNAPTPPVV